jgi:hypothetical protein
MQAVKTIDPATRAIRDKVLATVMVPNPDAKALPPAELVRHFQGVTTFKPPPEAKVKVRRAQSDGVGLMYDRRQISEAQYLAARQFQKLSEMVGRPLRSSGDIREYVDGGYGPFDGLTARRVAAARALEVYARILGKDGYSLVQAVLIDKRTIREVSDSGSMMPGKAATTFTGHLFRRQLSLLAKAMGFG